MTKQPRPFSPISLAALAVAVLACNLSTTTPTQPTPALPPTEPPVTASAASPQAEPGGTALPSIPSERPLIWFGPLAPMEVREGRPFIGSDDFMDLFSEDAPWPTAAGRVHVFKLYGEWVSEDATDAELRKAIADLNRRGIALAFEAGPLDATVACGVAVEGFGGLAEGRRIALRIKQAGGTVRFLAFDEPYAFAHLYDGPNACNWPAEKIAQGVGEYIQSMRVVFPDVIAGDIEPLWAGVDVAEYKTWLEAFRQVNGYNLSFFHLDPDYTRADWAEAGQELEQFARQQGVEFGIIYFGDWEDTADEQWIGKAEGRMVEYESRAGGRPDHVLFQSWHDHPDRVLPETDPKAFTHLVNRYFRTRTALTAELRQAGGEPPALAGVLTGASGAPISGAAIEFSLIPRTGEGVYFEHSLTGIVPEGAGVADVGYRVNEECDCAGASDFALYEVRYAEDSGEANRVPNGDFSQGLDGWGIWGVGQARLEPSELGPGQALHVTAAPGQVASANSGQFPVTAGAAFTVTFAARVSPGSVGSGYLGLIFLSGENEVSRVRIPLAPAAVPVGAAITAQDGSYESRLAEPVAGGDAIEAAFAGDEAHWPAYAEAVEN